MKSTKLWSVLLAAVLLCACALGVLFTSAGAAQQTVTLYVDAAGNDSTGNGSKSAPYATVEAALADLAGRTWNGDDSALIMLNGSIATKSSSESVLFGQKTIFTKENTKLPITIKGDSKTSDILTVSSKKVACANDYTFDTLTLPVEQNANAVFAGSGNIALNNVAFTTGTLKAKTPLFFGDTFTADVFEGWTSERIAKIKSQNERSNIATSVSFGTGSDVWHDAGACPGSSIGQTASWANASSTTIMPTDTEVSVILDGASIPKLAACYYNGAHKVALLRVIINSGVTDVIAADGNMSGTTTTIKSDVSLEMYGGSYKSGRTAVIRACYNDVFEGDVTILMEGGEMEYLQIGYSDPIIKGDAILKVGGTAKVKNTATGAWNKVEGKIENYVYGNCEIKNFRGLMYNQSVTTDKVVNNVSGGKITLFTGTSYQNCTVGTIINNISGGTIDQFYGGCISSGSKCTTLENNISGSAKITLFYGAYKGQFTTVTNNMKGGTITGTEEPVTSDKTATKLFYGTNQATVGTLNNNFSGTNFKNVLCAYYGTVTNVNNTVSASSLAKFYGTYYTTATNVKNTISGGSISGEYNGTYNSSVSKVETIVSGGTMSGNFYSQWAQKKTVGSVENTITGGTFSGTNTILGGYGGSIGSVTNTISGDATFSGSYLYFGAGSSYWPSVVGSVTNTVRGGTFTAGVRGGGAASTVTGDIINNIESGSFYTFFGGNENNYYHASNMLGMTDKDPTTSPYYCKSVQGTIKNTFGKEGSANGPSFTGSVICGDIAFNREPAENGYGAIENVVYAITAERDFCGGAQNNKGLATAIFTEIYGGTFARNVFAAEEDTACSSVSMNVTSTQNASLAFYGNVEGCNVFDSTATPVIIGKSTCINAQTVIGSVKLHQTEGWLSNEYFFAPLGTAFSITAEDGIFGAYETVETDKIVLRGADMTKIQGATLILDDRLNVRVLFNPEEMESYGDLFTFAASLNGTKLTVEAEEYSYNGTTYDSYVIKGLTLAQFTDTIEISGNTFADIAFSVVSLAETGADNSAAGSAAEKLFQSIANLGTYVNDSQANLKYALTADDVPAHETNASRTEGVTDVVLSTKTLIMSNAIGIRFAGVGTVDANTVKVTVNGIDVTRFCVFATTENSFTLDLYVNASMLTSPLQVKITNIPAESADEIVYLEYTERMDAFAKSVWNAGHESAKHALIFIQAVDAYKNA